MKAEEVAVHLLILEIQNSVLPYYLTRRILSHSLLVSTLNNLSENFGGLVSPSFVTFYLIFFPIGKGKSPF